jgi:hypothetical protein
MKWLKPRGLSASPMPPVRPESGSIECGKCHAVIYNPEKGFDSAAFQAAKLKHYSSSPECQKR